MLITAAVLVALRSYETGRGREAFIAGVLAGLATGVKYSSLFVLIPVVLAAATTKDKDRRGPSLALAMAGFVTALLVSNHFLWADIPNFLRQLSQQIGITGGEHWAAMDNPAAFHVSVLARQVVGWPLMIAAAGFATYRLGVGNWRWWLFLSFPLAYISFTAQRPAQFPRWVYPSAPFVAVAASAALFAIVGLLTVRTIGTDSRRRAQRVALGLCISVLLMSPILWAWAYQTSRRLATPTYTLVETWLEEQAPNENRLLIEKGWLDLPRPRFRPNRVDDLGAALDGALYQLAAQDWIVVHEGRLQHPSLRSLELVKDFAASTSFGGSLGPDFAIYRPPPIEPLPLPVSIGLDDPAATAFLGADWGPGEPGGRGRELPSEGASLYIPPVAPAGAGTRESAGTRAGESTGVRLELLLAADRGDEQARADMQAAPGRQAAERRGARRASPIEVLRGGRSLALELGGDAGDAGLVVTVELPNLGPQSRVARLLLRPAAAAGPVRVLGFRLH
jgi:hypothetical protein